MTSTTTSSDVRDIIIIGGSFAGQSAAHYILKHIAPALETHPSKSEWRISIIDTSTHFWWRIAAPRAMVTSNTVPHEKAFVSTAEGFEQYMSLKRTTVECLHAECISIDSNDRSVSVKHLAAGREGQAETLPFYSLIVASGTRTPTTLTSLHGDHTRSIAALDEMQQFLASGNAKEIVIAGGGPTGVETAGEIGQALNGTAGFFSSSPAKTNAKITLVTSGTKLLPVLSKSHANRAEKFLKRVGVEVVYGVRVESVDGEATALGSMKTVNLDNGTTLSADVYIPAAGTQPNSGFVPDSMLSAKGYVSTAKTLRVNGVGPRVYCVGDVGDYSADGGVMSLYEAVPVLGANFAADQWADVDGQKSTSDKEYMGKAQGTQFVPIGRSKGVGAFNGWSVPSIMVSMTKGKDYLLSMTTQFSNGTRW